MRHFSLFVLMIPGLALAQQTAGLPKLLTYHYDAARTGANLSETQLTPAKVSSPAFGKLFDLSVDGAVFAQPLYMPGLKVHGAVHNVLFVATENNSVYAFDADAGGQPLWHVNYNNGFVGVTVTPVSGLNDIGCGDLTPLVGITSTPVIDEQAGILYTVVKTKEVSSQRTDFALRIHSIRISTGGQALPPQTIEASVPGTCGNLSGGRVVFDALKQHQRASLLLVNHVLYIGFASHCDINPYNGWLLSYDAATLKQLSVLNTTPDDQTGECRGGIWGAGGGPSADSAGNVYFSTGNGGFNADQGGQSYSDSVLRVNPGNTGSTAIADYFTPKNEFYLDNYDLDLGSGSTVVMPDQPGQYPHLLIAAGKTGTIFILNRDNLGHYDAQHNQIIQGISRAINDGYSAYPAPVLFGNNLYYAPSNDVAKMFHFKGGRLVAQPAATGPDFYGYLGAGISLSAAPDGSNAILWALEGTSTPGVLHAYDANTLASLFNSNDAPSGVNVPGDSVKFSVPIVANGKVFAGTQNSVAVYGLK